MASRSQPLVLGDGMRAAGIAVALSASLLVTPMLSHAEGTGGGMSLTFATREVGGRRSLLKFLTDRGFKD